MRQPARAATILCGLLLISGACAQDDDDDVVSGIVAQPTSTPPSSTEVDDDVAPVEPDDDRPSQNSAIEYERVGSYSMVFADGSTLGVEPSIGPIAMVDDLGPDHPLLSCITDSERDAVVPVRVNLENQTPGGFDLDLTLELVVGIYARNDGGPRPNLSPMSFARCAGGNPIETNRASYVASGVQRLAPEQGVTYELGITIYNYRSPNHPSGAIDVLNEFSWFVDSSVRDVYNTPPPQQLGADGQTEGTSELKKIPLILRDAT